MSVPQLSMKKVKLNDKVYYWERNKVYTIRKKTKRDILDTVQSFNSDIVGISAGRDVLYVFLDCGSVALIEN